MAVSDPTLRREWSLLREGATMVLGIDEVGRGAIAGPVAVGVSVLEATVSRRPAPMPEGLRDSKLLSEARREKLHPLVAAWAPRSAVGVVDARDIEQIGIIRALGLAASRALGRLAEGGVDFTGAVALLDGSHDWLSGVLPLHAPGRVHPRVVTQVKADRDCAVVAAASVLAKVHRDRFMIGADAESPHYGWAGNKGYASSGHYAAIDEHGAHPVLHRLSWLRTAVALPGLEAPEAAGAA